MNQLAEYQAVVRLGTVGQDQRGHFLPFVRGVKVEGQLTAWDNPFSVQIYNLPNMKVLYLKG